MKTVACALSLLILIAIPAAAEVKKLSNDRLKEWGYSRLEGRKPFKLGCRYIIRSKDKTQVYRPSVVTAKAIGFAGSGGYREVRASNKTALLPAGNAVVTTWRNCNQL